MISKKEIQLHVSKPMNYLPIPKKEKRRVTREVMRQIFDVAGRFDGTSNVSINITARGNA